MKSKMMPKRNIGEEILDGLRELKRGEHGRVVNVPNVADDARDNHQTSDAPAALLEKSNVVPK